MKKSYSNTTIDSTSTSVKKGNTIERTSHVTKSNIRGQKTHLNILQIVSSALVVFVLIFFYRVSFHYSPDIVDNYSDDLSYEQQFINFTGQDVYTDYIDIGSSVYDYFQNFLALDYRGLLSTLISSAKDIFIGDIPSINLSPTPSVNSVSSFIYDNRWDLYRDWWNLTHTLHYSPFYDIAFVLKFGLGRTAVTQNIVTNVETMYEFGYFSYTYEQFNIGVDSSFYEYCLAVYFYPPFFS